MEGGRQFEVTREVLHALEYDPVWREFLAEKGEFAEARIRGALPGAIGAKAANREQLRHEIAERVFPQNMGGGVRCHIWLTIAKVCRTARVRGQPASIKPKDARAFENQESAQRLGPRGAPSMVPYASGVRAPAQAVHGRLGPRSLSVLQLVEHTRASLVDQVRIALPAVGILQHLDVSGQFAGDGIKRVQHARRGKGPHSGDVQFLLAHL